MEQTILPSSATEQKDVIAERLLHAAQQVLVVVFGFLPILFIPSISAPFGYSKVLFVVIGIFIALILFSFSALRSASLKGAFSIPLVLMWAVAGFALISSLLSGDIKDALIGDAIGTQTAVFIALLALTATVWSMFGSNKASVMRLFLLLGISTFVLALFHIVRIIFGAETLTLGIFQNVTASPIGGWNDLGIFFGLIIILALVALQQLRLSRMAYWLCVGSIIFSVGMLMIINFVAVWIVVGLVSLITVIYSLSRGRGAGRQLELGETTRTSGQPNFTALIMSIVVLLSSVLFVVTGSLLGNAISNAVNISYVEVRPSLSATTDIIKNVYGESILFGTGPNHFSDAWRTFKDPGINSTIFWNTNFDSGIGYIPTMFATMGLIGGALWVAFFLIFLVAGLRTYNVSEKVDAIWFFIGTASFVGGLYLWGMAFLYVPGPVLLLLAAVCTGLVIASYNATGAGRRFAYTLQGSGKGNIVLISLITVIIIGSISALYFVGNHYASVFTFNKSALEARQGVPIEEVELSLVSAFNLHKDDRYARRIAEFQLARISNLLQVQNPTEEQRTQFGNAIANGREAGNRAVALDPTDPDNWSVLGSVFYALVPGNIEGAYEESRKALERARELDPQNPARVLALARLELASGNTQGAFDLARVAVEMKRNYRDAVFFLSQLQIVRGELAEAAGTARGMTVLDPQNPVAFFQLGVIERELGNLDASTVALERAVALDRNYANARYFLAFNYSDAGRQEDAREQLEVVRQLNPQSELVAELLSQLGRGEQLRAPGQNTDAGASATTTTDLPVEESDDAVTNADESGVITEEDVESPLVTPVNQVSSGGDNEETATPENSEGATGGE